MNIYKVLNEITTYIENNLTADISYEELAKIMGVNVYTFQRIFSLLANVTIADYIRKRRLTLAGYDLYMNKDKIIDIAIKYNYNNATSFLRAFTRFHGIKPSLVTAGAKLKNFPQIKFNENIKMIQDMDYSIINLRELVLYGVKTKTTTATIKQDAPKFFKEVNSKYINKYGPLIML